MDTAVARRIARYRARRTRSAQHTPAVGAHPLPAEGAARQTPVGPHSEASPELHGGEGAGEEEPAEATPEDSSDSAVWDVASQDLWPASAAASQTPSEQLGPPAPEPTVEGAAARPHSPPVPATANGTFEDAWAALQGKAGSSEAGDEVEAEAGMPVHPRDPAPAPPPRDSGRPWSEDGACAARTAERRLCGRSPFLRLLLRPAIQDAIEDALLDRLPSGSSAPLGGGRDPAATLRLHAVVSPLPSGRERALRALEGDAAADWMQRLPLQLHSASATGDMVFSGMGGGAAQAWLLSRVRRGGVLETLIQRPAPANCGPDRSAAQPVVVVRRDPLVAAAPQPRLCLGAPLIPPPNACLPIPDALAATAPHPI